MYLLYLPMAYLCGISFSVMINPDQNEVCSFNQSSIDCSLEYTNPVLSMPLLTTRAYDSVNFDCLEMYNDSHSPPVERQLSLDNSVFQPGFSSKLYSFVYSHFCQFAFRPDLFRSVETTNLTEFVLYLADVVDSLESLALSFVDGPFSLTLNFNGAFRLGSNEALKGSTHVTQINIETTDGDGGFTGGFTIPSDFCYDMPNLTNVQFHTSFEDTVIVQVKTRAFYKLNQLEVINLGSTISRIESHSFDSIRRINHLIISVLHDAFQGTLFNNVSLVDMLDLQVIPNHGIGCPVGDTQCDVEFDLGSTEVRVLSIVMNSILFRLPQGAEFGQVTELYIKLTSVGFDSDRWTDSLFSDSADSVETFNLELSNQNHTAMFPIDFTLWSVKHVNLWIPERNSICDTSWLTLPASMETLNLSSNSDHLTGRLPLITRGIAVPLSLRISIATFIDCNCSISWIKQLIDCGRVTVDPDYLNAPCSFNHLISVAEFLASTRCCMSSDPPSLENEPNMPLMCDTFIPMPPELLYFNHSDLPQCKDIGHWRFDPCDVRAFYTGIPQTTTGPVITTSSGATTGSSSIGSRTTSVPHQTISSTMSVFQNVTTSNSTANPDEKIFLYVATIASSVVVVVVVITTCVVCRRRRTIMNQNVDVHVEVNTPSDPKSVQSGSGIPQVPPVPDSNKNVDVHHIMAPLSPRTDYGYAPGRDYLLRQLTPLEPGDGMIVFDDDEASEYDRLSYTNMSVAPSVIGPDYMPAGIVTPRRLSLGSIMEEVANGGSGSISSNTDQRSD